MTEDDNNGEIRTTNTKINDQISDEKRKRLIELVADEGMSIKSAAIALKIKYNTAKWILLMFNRHSQIKKHRKGGKNASKLTDAVVLDIENIISVSPGLTLREIQRKLSEKYGNEFSIALSTINKCLNDLKITLKLAHREIDRVNALEKIEQRKTYALWFNNFFNAEISKAVFVDESSFNLHLRKSFARSKVGTRVNIILPAVRGRSVTLIGALSINGIVFKKIISNTTVNGDVFSNCFRELCESLSRDSNYSNACIILDNARVHRENEIRDLTREFGITYKFLSPYSYMLNPLENAFSKIKNIVKTRLGNEESHDLVTIILEAAGSITADDSAGFYRLMLRNITNCAAGLEYRHQ